MTSAVAVGAWVVFFVWFSDFINIHHVRCLSMHHQIPGIAEWILTNHTQQFWWRIQTLCSNIKQISYCKRLFKANPSLSFSYYLQLLVVDPDTCKWILVYSKSAYDPINHSIPKTSLCNFRKLECRGCLCSAKERWKEFKNVDRTRRLKSFL